MLDNHVNRPAYVRKCLARAMVETGLSGPSGWGTGYGSAPMTHAKGAPG